jgi:hypothetical protein
VSLWLSGKAGKIQFPDILIALLCVWAMIAVAANGGIASAVQPSGIFFAETLGSYLLARVYIRDVRSFRTMVRHFCTLIYIILPFAIIQSLTSHNLLIDIFGKVFTVLPTTVTGGRIGLFRAQGSFDHPILYGVVCASLFSISYYVLSYRASKFRRFLNAALISVSIGLSLSAGALLPLFFQVMLIAWDFITKGIRRRWVVISVLFMFIFFVIDMLSNRTPFEVFISYLTFNYGSAYNRVLIWRYGSQNVLDNPILGIGFQDWSRPYWMHSSMDNFWLLMAVRYGIPGFGLLALATIVTMFKIGLARVADLEIVAYRNGIVISIVSLTIAVATVDLWNASYCVFMFLLGSGLWILDNNEWPDPKVKGISRNSFRDRRQSGGTLS